MLNILYRLKTCVRSAKSISFPEHENCNNIVSCYANNNKHNNHVEIRITLTGVYWSTNWTPSTGGQNSILNWVLKLNPLNQRSRSLPLFSYGVCLFIAARIIFLKHRPWTQNTTPPWQKEKRFWGLIYQEGRSRFWRATMLFCNHVISVATFL